MEGEVAEDLFELKEVGVDLGGCEREWEDFAGVMEGVGIKFSDGGVEEGMFEMLFVVHWIGSVRELHLLAYFNLLQCGKIVQNL